MDINRTSKKSEEEFLIDKSTIDPVVYNFDELLDASGGFGRMQLYCLIICFISLNGTNYFSFTLSFLELEPKFLCGPEGNRTPCETSAVCDNGQIISRDMWEIDWDNSIHNWMTDMEMFWLSSFRIALFGSLWLLGFAFCGILLKLGDRIGRRAILIIGVITNVFFSFGLFFINNIYSRYVLLFLYGVTCAKVVVTYIYVTELSPKRSGVYCWGVINCSDIITSIPIALYFLFISNEWRYFYSLSMVLSVISIPMILYIPESPKFLYESGRYSELRKIISRIAKVNRVEMDQNYAIDRAVERVSIIGEDLRASVTSEGSNKEEVIVEQILKEEDFSIMSELKKPIVIINLTIWSILFLAATFNYYMINFYLKYAGGNIFWEVILATISETIAYNVGSVMQSKLGTKKAFVAAFFSSMVTSIPLLFWYQEEWVVFACVFASRFGIAASFTLVYYVNQEIFPALFVPFSFTIWNFVARLFGIAAPQIAEIPKPFPILSFNTVSAVAILSILFLRKVKSEVHDKFEKLEEISDLDKTKMSKIYQNLDKEVLK